ncbi:MAG TPA: hypothetical protein DC064_20530 [Cyanobacteria bacterium UBA9273]|nr:hypothetical protein [Cyanobacteria bacterium UBA9273]
MKHHKPSPTTLMMKIVLPLLPLLSKIGLTEFRSDLLVMLGKTLVNNPALLVMGSMGLPVILLN